MPIATEVSLYANDPVRILIVDDNPANLLALEAVLEPLRQEVLLAHSGDEALKILDEKDCAIVLMDVHMPVLDGYQTVEAIRRRKALRHLPVVFLTAMFKDDSHIAKAYALGAVDFITKPFEPEFIRAKVQAFVVLYQHNQELKRQQERLAVEIAARHAAEVADHMKEEFIAIVSHDLRTPLNVILLAAEKLAMIDAGTDSRILTHRIVASSHHMEQLINTLVDAARARFGTGIVIEPTTVDLATLCQVPLDETRALHPAVAISLTTHGDLHGEWDAARVTQLLANLVGNAAQHGDGHVTISLRGDGDIVTTEIHNGGAPISPGKLALLFEPFQPRGKRRDRLGLGLYIAREIVRAHRGSIDVDSADGKGTTFTVRLPRRILQTAEQPAS